LTVSIWMATEFYGQCSSKATTGFIWQFGATSTARRSTEFPSLATIGGHTKGQRQPSRFDRDLSEPKSG
jgi:hypothetical protein